MPHPRRLSIRLSDTHRCWLLLAALLALHLTLWQLWLQRGNVAQGCDVYAHLNNQLHFTDALADFMDDPTLARAEGLRSSAAIAPAKWPRFTYLVSAAGAALLGRSTAVTVLFTNGVFTLAALLALFSMGRRLYGPRAALLGCVLFTLLPFTAHFGSSYGLDYPLTCMVTVTLAALIRAEGFRSRRWSILFGLAFTLTLLTKVQGILFLAGPVIHQAALGVRWQLRQEPGRFRRVPWNLVLAGSMAAILLVVLLPGSPAAYLRTFLYHTGATGMPATMVKEQLSVASLLFYPITLTLGLTPWVLALALTGLGLRGSPSRSLMLVTLLTPLLIFTFLISTKWQRFLLPAAPMLCLAAGHALMRIQRKRLRTAAVAGVLAATSALLLVMMFHKDLYAPIQDGLGRAGILTTRSFAHPPRADNYDQLVEDLVRFLRGRVGPDAPLNVAVMEDPVVGAGAAVLLQYMIRLHNQGRPLVINLSGQRPVPFFMAGAKHDQVIILSKARENRAGLVQRIYRRYLDGKTVRRAWPRNRYDYRPAAIRRRFSRAASLPELWHGNLRPGNYMIYLLGPSLDGGNNPDP